MVGDICLINILASCLTPNIYSSRDTLRLHLNESDSEDRIIKKCLKKLSHCIYQQGVPFFSVAQSSKFHG